MAGPVQHFKAALLDAWRNKVAADLCGREGFRGGPLLDVHSSLKLLNSLMLQKEIRLCFRVSCLGVSGMVSSWARFEDSLFLVDFVVHLMVMVTCFGNAPVLLLLRFVKILSFMISREWTRSIGQDACFGMAGFLCFPVSMGPPPWALDASESAGYLVEVALGFYSSGMVAEWSPSGELDEAGAASSMPDHTQCLDGW